MSGVDKKGDIFTLEEKRPPGRQVFEFLDSGGFELTSFYGIHNEDPINFLQDFYTIVDSLPLYRMS